MQLSLFYVAFTLCKLTSYSTRLMQICNVAKLIMADGGHQNLRGLNA
jgi:hypothetical protein